jgi:hypothetical protein
MMRRMGWLLMGCMLAVACQDASAPSSIPPAPENVRTSARFTEILITWRDLTTRETKYRVELQGENGAWSLLGETGADATSFTHTNVQHGVIYHYRVQACNDSGCSAWTETSALWQGALPPTANPPIVQLLVNGSVNIAGSAAHGGLTTSIWFIVRLAGTTNILFDTDPSTITPPLTDGGEYEGHTVQAFQQLFGLQRSTDYQAATIARNALGADTSTFTSFRTRD